MASAEDLSSSWSTSSRAILRILEDPGIAVSIAFWPIVIDRSYILGEEIREIRIALEVTQERGRGAVAPAG